MLILVTLATISERRIGGPTKFTTWDIIDHMFQCTNHYTKDRFGNINWRLELGGGGRVDAT